MILTNRQKAYRAYLQTDQWKELRRKAIARDGGKCLRCGSVFRLQVHHTCYRGKFENSLLEDLETVCRECHGREHGLYPSDFMVLSRAMLRSFNLEIPVPPSQWKELRQAIEDKDDLWDFGDLMFRYIFDVISHRREGHVTNWWMDREKSSHWRNLAFAVRSSIQDRAMQTITTLIVEKACKWNCDMINYRHAKSKPHCHKPF